jgi:hypothetical protein
MLHQLLSFSGVPSPTSSSSHPCLLSCPAPLHLQLLLLHCCLELDQGHRHWAGLHCSPHVLYYCLSCLRQGPAVLSSLLKADSLRWWLGWLQLLLYRCLHPP